MLQKVICRILDWNRGEWDWYLHPHTAYVEGVNGACDDTHLLMVEIRDILHMINEQHPQYDVKITGLTFWNGEYVPHLTYYQNSMPTFVQTGHGAYGWLFPQKEITNA